MDKLTRFREIIPEILKGYTRGKHAFGEIESRVIADRDHDHYLMYDAGWQGRRRVYGTVIHLDIIDGKIWVQYDGTDHPVAEELVRAGVPREDIVLAFHPQDMRRHTEYAVG